MRSEQQRTRSLRRRNKGVLEEPGLGRVRLAREWHRIVAWGNLTKFAQTLKKGEHVYVSCELPSRTRDNALPACESFHNQATTEGCLAT